MELGKSAEKTDVKSPLQNVYKWIKEKERD